MSDAAALIARALRLLDDAAALGDGNARYPTAQSGANRCS